MTFPTRSRASFARCYRPSHMEYLAWTKGASSMASSGIVIRHSLERPSCHLRSSHAARGFRLTGKAFLTSSQWLNRRQSDYPHHTAWGNGRPRFGSGGSRRDASLFLQLVAEYRGCTPATTQAGSSFDVGLPRCLIDWSPILLLVRQPVRGELPNHNARREGV